MALSRHAHRALPGEVDTRIESSGRPPERLVMPLVGDARPVEDMTDDDGLALAVHAARWVQWRCLG